MRIIDMHVHSTYSDGSYTPEEIAKAAKRRGVSLIALTDHDTTAGLEPFMHACRQRGLNGLCGIELSAESPYTLHILGYRITPGCKALEHKLEEIRRNRDERNIKICEKLQKLKMKIDIDEVRAISNGEVVARPHIAKLMVSKGYVPNLSAAFAGYIGRNGIAYVDKDRIPADECIRLIKQAGGVASLAHPAQCMLNREGLEELLTRLQKAGLWGIEAVYGSNNPEVTKLHMELASKFGLYTTAGSDFHGLSKPGIEIGMTVGDGFLPWARFEK